MLMVIVNRLSKQIHLSAVTEKMTASELAKVFLRDVWKHHGLPDSIVSDRGSLFVSEFWRAYYYQLQISLDLSTAFHPESNGQTKCINSAVAAFLRQYIDLSQKDWEEWLPMAEYSLNNMVSSTTGMSPFFANHGFHPRMSFGAPRPLSKTASKQIREGNEAGTSFVNKMEEILEMLRANMLAAQAKYEETANIRRDSAPAYRIGDEVFLDTRNLPLDVPNKKFAERWHGPLTITRAWTHHYELKLDFELETRHSKFHTNLLRLAPTSYFPGQVQLPSPAIEIDENDEKIWAIEAILDSQCSKEQGFKYLVM